MFEWIKQSKSGITLLFVAILTGSFMVSASGCSLGDVVKFSVPDGVQALTGSQSKVTYNQSAILVAQWNAVVKANADLLQSNIDSAGFIVDLGSMLINVGIQNAEGPLAAVPGGALILAGLTGIGGMLTRKPGDAKALNMLQQALANAAAERERAVREAADRAWDEATLAAKKAASNE